LVHYSRERLVRFIQEGETDRETDAALGWIQKELDIKATQENARMIRGMAAVKAGASLDDIGKTLSWREFESFCATLLRVKGFEVSENLTLTRPRAQIDILARSHSIALVVDCKHWAKEMGPSALDRVVMAQARRAQLLRSKRPELEPMIVVVLSLANESGRYVRPGVVVPVHTLGDFISGLTSYTEDIPRF
jgi:hypothetical protein